MARPSSARSRRVASPLVARALPIALALTAAACGKASDGAAGGAMLGLTLAPLELPGVSYVCYDLAVTGPSGLVTRRGDPATSYLGGDSDTLCSWQYGNGEGGDVAYVAPCDADDGDGDAPAAADNTVTVWFDGLYRDDDGDHDPDEDVALTDWQDPCPDGCSVRASCRENADTAVRFAFTVLRSANQGFFDIGVEFDDVFCSAKLDCVDALLHDPATGLRGQTVVVGFACTAGPGQDTTLYMNDIRVDCAGPPAASYLLDPSLGAGQHGPLPSAGQGEPVFFQTATYFGREDLPGLDKCYWNHALGVDPAALGPGCTLHLRATAAEAPFAEPAHTSPAGVIRPVVTFDVPLTDLNGALVCDDAPHPMNGGNGVATAYGPIEGERFTHAYACDEGATPSGGGRTSCSGSAPGAEALTVTQTVDGVVVALGDGAPSAAFDLAPGLSITTCCGDPCCP